MHLVLLGTEDQELLQLPLAHCVAWAPTQLLLGLWLLPPVPTVLLAPMELALDLLQLPPVPFAGWVPTLLSRVHLWR